MISIGFIPLRKGSKGIKNKNKKIMLGRPLFAWVLIEAIFSKLNVIYVYTDDKELIDYIEKEYKWSDKVRVIMRSEDSASDTASTEFAMKEFAEKINYNFDFFCLLQATSPLTSRRDINKAIETLDQGEYDSVLSVVKTKRFLWDANGKSVNYDYHNRPRRQDFDGILIENGAVYITTKKQFITSGNRIGGKVTIFEMEEDTLIEIDENSDWIIVEKLIEKRLTKFAKNLKKIKAICLDVDGVFTDCKITFNKNGEFSKKFSMQDGMGLEIARLADLKIIVITSENSKIVEQRMKKLGIKDYFLDVKDKYARLEQVLNHNGINRDELAYIGDDINDLANICSVNWGIVPQNAVDEIKIKADLILKREGGNGAIREAVHFIIRYNERF